MAKIPNIFFKRTFLVQSFIYFRKNFARKSKPNIPYEFYKTKLAVKTSVFSFLFLLALVT